MSGLYALLERRPDLANLVPDALWLLTEGWVSA